MAQGERLRPTARFKRAHGFSRCVLLAFLTGACGVIQDPDTEEEAPATYGSIVLAPCQLASPGLSQRVSAECGEFEVPEDRSDPNSRPISLSIAIKRAVVKDRALEPVIYLAGGPGQSAIESYVALASAFAPLRRRHDIVLIDQRGTGASNPLDCPDTEDEDETVRMDIREETVAGFAAECFEALEAEGSDPRHYTTSVAIDDLEAVRLALGVERFNLVGISYGTRVAQSYAARYPERTRSIVLDGVVPQDWPLGSSIAADAQRALNAVLARCESDVDCLTAFGRPETWSPAVLRDRLTEAPSTIQVRHPLEGSFQDIEVTPDVVAMTIRLLLYGSETAALLPLVLDAASEGDLSPLAAQFMLIAGELESGISGGMGNSVTCAEDVPRLEAREAAAALESSEEGTFLADAISRSLRGTCSAWPRGEADEALWQPLLSDVPALLISGEWDPVTPLEGAEHVLAGLPNGHHLVAKGQGHSVLGRGCMPSVVADFVDTGTVDGLESGCLDSLAAMPFFTSFAGPQP